jgi:hypothetical protein
MSKPAPGLRARPRATVPGRALGPARVDALAQKHLGMRLRAAYEDLVSEPVPEHLSDLVRRLEAADRRAEPPRRREGR